MSFSDFALILRWVLPLWALGWLVFPFSSRLLSFLPDRGLAAGRVIALVLLSLTAFWGAAVHIVPLSLAPVAFIVAPLAIAYGWKNRDWRTSLRGDWPRFLLSDLVFLTAFAAFLWVRMRHPEAGDLEKPMDMALLSAAQRATFLPFQNPWFAGENFTNYYYFGPLMGGLLARTFATPPYLAYNLVQPLFCAFFLSVTWSLGAALSKSSRIGLLVMLLVCVGGHFEPLRQIKESHHGWTFEWWRLDKVVENLNWWETSRVVENTINEYPAFSMLIGDLHAHFYAFSLAVTHFCLCFGLLQARSERGRSALLLVSGAFLAVITLTNTWDTPLYGLLWLTCAFWSRRSGVWTLQNTRAAVATLVLIPVAALPFFWRFKSQVSGVAVDFWMPPLFSMSLLWGGWWMLGIAAIGLGPGEEKPDTSAIFRRLLLFFGLIALVLPFFFTIRGYFGGDLRHQDTVFKFGLQAWLLGGLGLAAEVGWRGLAWWRRSASPRRFAGALVTVAFLGLVSLAPACVAWTRTSGAAPRDYLNKPILSLNAARFLPDSDLKSIEWLRQNAKIGESVVEAVGNDGHGGLGGDYDANCGRVAAFSGVPDALGWPQHVWMWGTPMDDVNRRGALIAPVFRPPFSTDALRPLGTTYLFLGAQEGNSDGELMMKFRAKNPDLKPVETQILRFPG